ncbi:hypothetical protein AB0G32_08900 [Streptomyces sp. NPDC023723]|uniref:hypothetical protein n=1 Tax=Streptomyces sp. NPDC023723 TaxID=3154323 RepID=UPI0033D92D69
MEIPYAALNGAYWLDDGLAPCPDCVRLLDTQPAADTGPARGAGHRPVTAVWRAVARQMSRRDITGVRCTYEP